jgi:hypothetical protein
VSTPANSEFYTKEGDERLKATNFSVTQDQPEDDDEEKPGAKKPPAATPDKTIPPKTGPDKKTQ